MTRLARDHIRNIAIVAHVDHGKTTLVDHMLRQAGVFREGQAMTDRVLDSVDQERERGITILAKNASVTWQGHKINIVDTPGHADFGGEVERSLRLVDGVLLLVDAAEGPLPQTRFVLGKAMEAGLPAVVVVNKVDRKDARPEEVLDEIYALFIDLGADDHQIEFPVVYAVAKEGRAGKTLEAVNADGATLQPLFDAILGHLPPPPSGEGEDLSLLVSNLDHDDYIGRLAIGRVRTGEIRAGQQILVCGEGDSRRQGKIANLFVFDGLGRKATDAAGAGEIVAVSGLPGVGIGDTLCDVDRPRPLPRITVDPPTLAVVFRINDGPFAGRAGKYVTSRQLRERLFREDYRNVAIRVEETGEPDSFRVSGRGELQLAVLIESMRREGYELTVSNPEPVLHREGDRVLEPYELITCELPDDSVGRVSEVLGPRRARMVEMRHAGSGRNRVVWRVPARGLIGFRPVFLTETRGEGILAGRFDGYDEWAGPIVRRVGGAIISDRTGETVPYGLFGLADRGVFFVGPGVPVYEGMVVGEHTRENDLVVNVCRTKKLTNVRAAGKDENVILAPPRDMNLERAMEWIDDDELIEVTPGAIRLRKRYLDPNVRLRMARGKKVVEQES